MQATHPILPEDVLIAMFHRVGNDVRITDDERLARIIGNASSKNCERNPFAPFKLHPRYGYSRVFGDTLQTLDHAGSIVRENASQLYFRATEHTAGPFGASVYELLDTEQRTMIDEVAQLIRQEFKDANEQRSRHQSA